MDINEHPAVHTSLFLSTMFTSLVAHITKSDIAMDVTIILGLCGILNYLISWCYKLYNHFTQNDDDETDKSQKSHQIIE